MAQTAPKYIEAEAQTRSQVQQSISSVLRDVAQKYDQATSNSFQTALQYARELDSLAALYGQIQQAQSRA